MGTQGHCGGGRLIEFFVVNDINLNKVSVVCLTKMGVG